MWEKLRHRLSEDKPFFGLTLVLSAVLVLAVGVSLAAVIQGDMPEANALGSITVGLATLLLVMMTARYTSFTRELVRETRLGREEEKQRKLRSLRRGLLYEIQGLPEDKIESMGFRDTKRVQKIASNTVFEQNADQLGLLTEEELKPVLKYYQQLAQFEQYLNAYAQREGGSNIQREAKPLIKAKNQAVDALESNLQN